MINNWAYLIYKRDKRINKKRHEINNLYVFININMYRKTSFRTSEKDFEEKLLSTGVIKSVRTLK